MPLFLDLIINTFVYLGLGLELGLELESGLVLGLVLVLGVGLGLALGVELGLGGDYAIGSSSYRYKCSYHATFTSVPSVRLTCIFLCLV